MPNTPIALWSFRSFEQIFYAQQQQQKNIWYCMKFNAFLWAFNLETKKKYILAKKTDLLYHPRYARELSDDLNFKCSISGWTAIDLSCTVLFFLGLLFFMLRFGFRNHFEQCTSELKINNFMSFWKIARALVHKM